MNIQLLFSFYYFYFCALTVSELNVFFYCESICGELNTSELNVDFQIKLLKTVALGKTLPFYYFTTGLKLSYNPFCTSVRAIDFFENLLFLDLNVCISSTDLLALLFYVVNKFTLLLDGVKQGPKVHNVHAEPS